MYNDFKVLEIKCHCCQSMEHDIEKCPMLSLQLDRKSIIGRYNFSGFQERKSYSRKLKKRIHALGSFRDIENKALKIEIPANFSSSCENPSEGSDENLNSNILQKSTSLLKLPMSPKAMDGSPKDSSLKCYETMDDLGGNPMPFSNPNIRSSSKKNSSIIEGKQKPEDLRKKSIYDQESSVNQKFCSLEILLQKENMKQKPSEMELNLPGKSITDEEKEKEDTVSNLSQNTTFNSKMFGDKNSSQQKINISKFASSKEEIAKRNSSSFSFNSIQNLNNFFQTDEILGGTTKAGTTTVATIYEFLLKNFEIMGSYKIYFPHNNYENVLKWCRILQKGKKK